MNFDYYKIFYCVGKHGNITRAAEELMMSQPAVSRAISNLEGQLNCALFARSKAGVKFTREGEKLFEYISASCAQLIKAEAEINELTDPESGTIYIGSTVTALYGFLFKALNDYHARHPKVKFCITTASSDSTIDKLLNGDVEVSFVTTPYRIDRNVKIVKVREFNDILIAGNRYPELKKKVLTLEALSEYPFICLNYGMQLREFIDDFFAKNGLNCFPDIESDSADLIVSMVQNGLGIGFVPLSMAQPAIERGEVFKVNLAKELPPRNICMVSDPSKPRSAKCKEFIKSVLGQIR